MKKWRLISFILDRVRELLEVNRSSSDRCTDLVAEYYEEIGDLGAEHEDREHELFEVSRSSSDHCTDLGTEYYEEIGDLDAEYEERVCELRAIYESQDDVIYFHEKAGIVNWQEECEYVKWGDWLERMISELDAEYDKRARNINEKYKGIVSN